VVFRQRALAGAAGIDRYSGRLGKGLKLAGRGGPENSVTGNDERPVRREKNLDGALDAAGIATRPELVRLKDLRAASLSALSTNATP
jgi:hypothetical protein